MTSAWPCLRDRRWLEITALTHVWGLIAEEVDGIQAFPLYQVQTQSLVPALWEDVKADETTCVKMRNRPFVTIRLRTVLFTIKCVSTSAPNTCSTSWPASDLQSKHLHSEPGALLAVGHEELIHLYDGGRNVRWRLRLRERPWLLWPLKSVRVCCGCPLTSSAANPCPSAVAPFPHCSLFLNANSGNEEAHPSRTPANQKAVSLTRPLHSLYTASIKTNQGKNTVLWGQLQRPIPHMSADGAKSTEGDTFSLVIKMVLFFKKSPWTKSLFLLFPDNVLNR